MNHWILGGIALFFVGHRVLVAIGPLGRKETLTAHRIKTQVLLGESAFETLCDSLKAKLHREKGKVTVFLVGWFGSGVIRPGGPNRQLALPLQAIGWYDQWSFLVPLIGGRYHIIRQLAVYTTYIPLIYCLLGGLYATYHLLREPRNSIGMRMEYPNNVYI